MGVAGPPDFGDWGASEPQRFIETNEHVSLRLTMPYELHCAASQGKFEMPEAHTSNVAIWRWGDHEPTEVRLSLRIETLSGGPDRRNPPRIDLGLTAAGKLQARDLGDWFEIGLEGALWNLTQESRPHTTLRGLELRIGSLPPDRPFERLIPERLMRALLFYACSTAERVADLIVDATYLVARTPHRLATRLRLESTEEKQMPDAVRTWFAIKQLPPVPVGLAGPGGGLAWRELGVVPLSAAAQREEAGGGAPGEDDSLETRRRTIAAIRRRGRP